jgi:hypothetical protein
MNVEELGFLDEIDCSEIFPGDRRERILCFEADAVLTGESWYAVLE